MLQAWLGYGSIQITARYLHDLGDFADPAALDVLNKAGRPRDQSVSVASCLSRSASVAAQVHPARGAGEAWDPSSQAMRQVSKIARGGHGVILPPPPAKPNSRRK